MVGSGTDTANDPLKERCQLLLGTVERTKARHGVRVVEVPCVFRKPDEVADRRIGLPSATKRRTAQILWNTLAQERRDVGLSGD